MLHEALRLIRVYHDMKLSDTAVKLGISKSYLSEIEHGRKKPTLEIVDKYAEIFNLPVSSIMFFSENMGNTDKFQKARFAVASKVVNLLKFLEARSDRTYADAD